MDKFTFFHNKDKPVRPATNPGNAAWKRSMQSRKPSLPLHTETLENHKADLNEAEKKRSSLNFEHRRASHDTNEAAWLKQTREKLV